MRKNVIVVLVIGVLASACNMEASITNLENPVSTSPQQSLQKASGNALTSGSHTRQTASGGYKVYSTVGNLQTKTVNTSTGGYKVFTNLDGQIHAE